MKKGREKPENGSFWVFALINGRLAEFHYEIRKGKFYMTYGHCYVKHEEYKTQKEQRWIDRDTKKYRFTYQKGKYRRVGEKMLVPIKHLRISRNKKRQMH